jgi:hypothetical protein
MKTIGRYLSLAAAPTFAITAIVAGIQNASVSSGPVPMYALMAVFSSVPWLEWVSLRSRNRGSHD